MKNDELIFVVSFQILILFLVPFIGDFWIISLLLTILTSLYVILFVDNWTKYFYPAFVMSCFIIVMRIFGLDEFLELKELFFAASWIWCSLWCIVLAIWLIFKE